MKTFTLMNIMKAFKLMTTERCSSIYYNYNFSLVKSNLTVFHCCH